jgi:CheY-like chemotaxis protein
MPRAIAQTAIPDDRAAIQPGDRVLLIVEDDETFATTLLDVARERGFRGVVTTSGSEAIECAKSLKPDAITLDLVLPDMDGWVLLDRLKHDVETRHIPVHIISAAGEERRGLELGAVAVLTKPIEREVMGSALGQIQEFIARRVKRLLVVEDDEAQREAIVELIGEGDVEIHTVASAEEALAALEGEPFDCMVLDLKLPGMSGMELIRTIKDNPGLRRLPVIVYTGKELSREEQTGLAQLADTVIVKDVRSPERLLDETALFLHRVESSLPEPKRKMLRTLAYGDPMLKGRKVLVVDDDVRNIFAITSVLERHEMEVLYAENGQDALDKLAENGDVDAVLMDIMMPEMDGYEAMRRIRQQAQLRTLPIIALTAKAMKGDREKCIEAGASDYVTKPVDPDQLISLLRVWLYR